MKRKLPVTKIFILLASLAWLLMTSGFTAVIPTTAGFPAVFQDANVTASLPTISHFVQTLDLNATQTVTGIYIPNTFAFNVIQQPGGAPGYVSSDENVITQFRMASEYGTTGLLAHNHLAGAAFSNVQFGQTIVLVNGDGSLKYYHVTAIERYQALSPNSPYSNFRNLDVEQPDISATQLFMRTYAIKGQLVLQTCIASGDEPSWGRLFILAQPIEQFVPES